VEAGLSLAIGQTLSQYRLIAKIGEGGMGTVWKALDIALGREVAIKIVSEAFATDTEYMTRFEREAKVLGSLNHPNIATIFGLHQADTAAGPVRFIAMEFVPGENLSQRLEHGALPLDAALDLAHQVAGALEAAHEKGVIHRDLKPANVGLTEDGEVKVLDFGLAKSFGDEAIRSLDPDLSPTLTSNRTRDGVILGTVDYMSPEQARGHAVDKRTDIWAFGCILFEVLTGVRLFRGESASDVLAEVLKGEPAWILLPDDTPVEISQLLRRCLAKSRRDRLHDVADARLVIDDLLAQRSSPGTAASSPDQKATSPTRRRLGLVSAAAIAVTALVAGLLGGWFMGPSAERTQGSFTIELPEGLVLALDACVPFALSPDGTHIVFVGVDGPNRQLYRRQLDSFEVEPISGTAGAMGPAFSPDGRWIAFVDLTAGQIKKIDAAGGAAIPLGETTDNTKGLHWGTADRLVLTTTHRTGLSVLDAETGEVLLRTEPDRGAGEKTHRHPHLLPGGDTVVFMRGTADLYSYDDAEIEWLDLATGNRRRLIEDGAGPIYISTGHILFARGGALLASPFSLRTGELTGPSVEVFDGITIGSTSGTAYYAVSAAGHLAYLPGGHETLEYELVFVDRDGRASPSKLENGRYDQLSVSPSGRKLALEIGAANDNIWIHDLDRGASTRLTTAWDSENPVWTSDDETVLYNTVALDPSADGADDVVGQAADGSSPPELLVEDGSPDSWARRGKQLAFGRDGDIWVLDPNGDGEPVSFLATGSDEYDADFTQDGHWLAYVSDESERAEVYVVPYPTKDKRWQVSVDGGEAPRWSFDERELYYVQGQTMMVVDVETTPEFSVSPPRPLFELDPRYEYNPSFDLFPDGRFAMIRAEKTRQSRIRIVLHWLDRFRDRR